MEDLGSRLSKIDRQDVDFKEIENLVASKDREIASLRAELKELTSTNETTLLRLKMVLSKTNERVEVLEGEKQELERQVGAQAGSENEWKRKMRDKTVRNEMYREIGLMQLEETNGLKLQYLVT